MTVASPPAMTPRLAAFVAAPDPEAVFFAQCHELIAARRGAGQRDRGDGPVRLLLVGYSGAGNTGADVRVLEIIRQVHAIFGRDQVEMGVVLVRKTDIATLFPDAVGELSTGYLVDFLDRVSPGYDGMLACEGSMFKSKNSNVFSGTMAAAVGLADAEGKLAVGYGADVGPMDPPLHDLVKSLGTGPLMMCRSPESAAVLDGMGLRTVTGADTAWSFDPAPRETAQAILAGMGLEPGQKLLVACPVNAFWWPVRPDMGMLREMEATGAHRDLHYGKMFFHSDSPERRSRYDRYLAGFAQAVTSWRERTGGMALLVGMERLDAVACADLAARLPNGAATLVSGDRPMQEIVAMLRCADLLVSSRYHAIVTSMPGLVPAIGVSMDERIANLLGGYGAGNRILEVDDPALGEKLTAAMVHVEAESDAIRVQTGREVARQLRNMARMGRDFAAEACRVYPTLTPPPDDAPFERFLPPLAPNLVKLLQDHE
jgi:polysaccharide pyruvyl transferase WcaK-like protein